MKKPPESVVIRSEGTSLLHSSTVIAPNHLAFPVSLASSQGYFSFRLLLRVESLFLGPIPDESVGFFQRMLAFAGHFVKFFKAEDGTVEFFKDIHSYLVVLFLPLLIGFGIHSLGAFVFFHTLLFVGYDIV